MNDELPIEAAAKYARAKAEFLGEVRRVDSSWIARLPEWILRQSAYHVLAGENETALTALGMLYGTLLGEGEATSQPRDGYVMMAVFIRDVAAGRETQVVRDVLRLVQIPIWPDDLRGSLGPGGSIFWTQYGQRILVPAMWSRKIRGGAGFAEQLRHFL